ncbi:MAG: FtsX-like permease family protein [Spirochaetaceae bacterium]|jgi:ABC-type lipoprotein release transport system permease subunit|nr:FtsX-like permease family protein [Spirochaetaceae bacterium]
MKELVGTLTLKSIALRNLARHKVKTILTCSAIMVSVTVYIWMDSWLGGIALESRRNIINYELGAAKLQTKLYFEKKDELPAYENFADWETYAEVLNKAGYNTAPRYVFSGTLYSMTGSAPLLIHAGDPAAEARTLSYMDYVDLGRPLTTGEFGIILGGMTADKLKVGIPTRPSVQELEDLIESGSFNRADADFIRSCYKVMEIKRQFGETKQYAAERAKGRLILKRDLAKAERDRLWSLVDSTGCNDVRISAVIDYKMAPEALSETKWDIDLFPALQEEEQQLLSAAYEFDSLTGAYLLVETDEEKLSAILAAMIRADFSGAVRHVNQVIDAKVVGTINSPDPFNNYNIGYMPLDVLQAEAGMMLEGHITELLIRDKTLGVADMNSPIESAAAIRKALEDGLAQRGKTLSGELDVFFWTDYMQDFLKNEAADAGMTKILSILLFFLAFIGISNTMLLAILERTKEIGMMQALGMTSGQLIVTYLIEAGFLGIIGSLCGIIVGCLLNIPMVKYGIDFSELTEQMSGNSGYRIAGNFRGMWKIDTIIGSGIMATVISSCMAYFPARRATKKAITENLRFE